MSERIRLDIEGMTCDHCEITVSKTLEWAGLEDVRADWRRGRAEGRAADFSPQRAAQALQEVGYKLVGTSAEAPDASQIPAFQEGDYDLLVIGSGSAAFAAAITARELGARVALVERHTIGGTCVNVGCVPSKALLRPAELYWQATHHHFSGMELRDGKVDLQTLVAQKDELVQAMRKEKYEDLADLHGFEVISGQGRFVGPDAVEVDGQPVTAAAYLVATGAAPWVPPIPGLAETGYLTSTTALELTELPEELLVVGANAIGLELGQLFLHLGSRVTFVEVLPRIAPFEEPEISEALADHLKGQGGELITSAKATEAGREGDRAWLEVEVEGRVRRLEAHHLLMATGRRAQTEGLGLEAAGVATDPRGHVVVDDQMATSNPKVWAAGDCTTAPQFVYVAARQGSIAAENALRSADRRIEYRTVPRVTFTAPQVASVGMTEEEARTDGRAVISSVLPISVVPRAQVNRETTGLVKLVADEASGELLGAHVLAEGAGDVIQGAIMALRYHATVDELADTYHPYLTMAEGLKLAAQGFRKDVKQLSCCAA
ncbi:MAG: mercury(II) reductase [Acidimicrobiia bacterium]